MGERCVCRVRSVELGKASKHTGIAAGGGPAANGGKPAGGARKK